MSSPRWRKVSRDLWHHRGRTVLVALAIAVGLAAAGAVLNAWALARRVVDRDYPASNPASATLYTDSIDAQLLARVRALPAVREAEARRTVLATLRAEGGWLPAALFTTDDLTAVRIGRLRPESGVWPPGRGEIAIEHSSVEWASVELGRRVAVQLSERDPGTLVVTGTVRDVGLAPGWMEHIVYAFVGRETLEALGGPAALNELRIVTRDSTLDRDGVRRVAWDVKRLIESTGRRVPDLDVPEPGQHIHAGQMNSLLYTQGAFGVLALILSGVLVVNLMTAMLTGQVREIGVMKTLGARPEQLAGMYLVLAGALGLAACAAAIPVAAVIGRRYAALKTELLNFDVTGHAIPLNAIALQVLVGVTLPIVAAAGPVARGCRLSVAGALRDTGLAGEASAPWLWLSRVPGLARPLLLSIRNTFRRRRRAALTLATLALAGAVYLAALNLRTSIRGAVGLAFRPQRQDVTLRLTEPWPVDSIERVVGAVAGVTAVEAWGVARGAVSYDDETDGDAFAMLGPPPASRLLALDITEGRWLEPGDDRALVVGRRWLRGDTTLRVGAPIWLSVAGARERWTIVGVFDNGPNATYAPRATLARLTNGSVDAVFLTTDLAGVGSQLDLIQRLRGELGRAGMSVRTSQRTAENRQVVEDHLLMVGDFLGSMAWLLVVVGGLGLASTMSLNVLERTREIGVLRAIGARHGSILSLIVIEGLFVGVLSWLVATPLSVPVSLALGRTFGRIMLPVPDTLLPDGSGLVRWLAVVAVVSLLACAAPARRALKVATAAALAYE